jgi:hypothetical protein
VITSTLTATAVHIIGCKWHSYFNLTWFSPAGPPSGNLHFNKFPVWKSDLHYLMQYRLLLNLYVRNLESFLITVFHLSIAWYTLPIAPTCCTNIKYLEKHSHVVQGTFIVPEHAVWHLWDLKMYTSCISFLEKLPN